MRASMFVTFGIGGLAVLVASGFVVAYAFAVHRTGGPMVLARRRARLVVLGWMTLFAVLAERGLLARFDLTPPPMAIAMLTFIATGLALGYSSIGETFVRGLPLAWLVGTQAFRLPLEIVMHAAAQEGVMPREMSYAGYNFDIVTGVTALIVAALVHMRRASRALVYAWNILGSVLLLNILVVAVLATPMVAAFGDDPAHLNVWVAHFPFVWLGAILVVAAIFGHVVIFRALCAYPKGSGPTPDRE